MPTVTDRLYAKLEAGGYKGKVVSISHLQDVRDELEGRHAQGLFDADFYQETLTFFAFQPPENLPQAASLIVVAEPRPRTKVTVTWKGRPRTLDLPPTFMGFKEMAPRIGGLLSEWLAPEGCRVVRARLPQKLLAVRSGLASYGRNNIAYIPGIGSFFQIAVFWSDLPCTEDDWREPRMMDRCKVCRICRNQCPTAAITDDRFLIRSERCLCFLNERAPEHPFPAWIDPASHNCLLGCLLCQLPCPENQEFLNWFDGNEAFSEEETAMLMQGTSADRLPPATLAKLERLDLADYLGAMPRNLGVFLEDAGSRSS